jgi:predicted permease
LFVRTVRQLQRVDPGFDVSHIATFTLNLNAYKENPIALLKTFTDRVRTIPGVVSVAVSSNGVMKGVVGAISLAPAGQRLAQADFLNTGVNGVSPEYFDTMGMRILFGRGFVPGDAPQPRQTGPQRIVVNQTLVRQFFPDTQPLGRLLGTGRPGEVVGATFEIVGVVSDSKYRSLRAPLVPVIYLYLAYIGQPVLNVRTRMRPEAIIAPVRKTLTALDPALPFIEVHTLAEEANNSMATERITANIASLFGVVATLLVGVGIYGLLAYMVTQRLREIGIRMALGAQRGAVLALVVGQALKLTIIGVGIGIVASLALTRLLAKLLYGVKPTDPLSFVMASLFLIALTLLASYLPARRATKVDPMQVLRYE